MVMLDVYGKAVEDRLAKAGVLIGISDPHASKPAQAKQVIAWIREFGEKYGIAPTIPEIQEADFNEIADSIMLENFVYPTKVVFSRQEIFSILRTIKG